MGKGQAAILLIIVALVAIFLFISPQVFRPSAPVEPIRYKNDIITLENFEVSNLRPAKGSIVAVSFDVANNGDKEVEDVQIDFSGTTIGSGDDVTIVEHEGCTPLTEEKRRRIKGIPIPFTSEVAKKFCFFDKIDSLDSRKVTVNYRVVDDGTRNIVAKVTYWHTGTREALIPIIDDKTVKVPKSKFSQSQPSFGPFVVDIIPPTKGWAIGIQPFELVFKLRFVGSTAVGTPTEPLDKLKLKKGGFMVILQGLKVVSCPQLTKKSDTEIKNDNIDMVVNKEYSCNFQAIGATGTFGYKLGIVKIGFTYDYGFVRSQTITIRPVPSPTEPSEQVGAPTTAP
jgi:hypothetical protein